MPTKETVAEAEADRQSSRMINLSRSEYVQVKSDETMMKTQNILNRRHVRDHRCPAVDGTHIQASSFILYSINQ